MFKVFIVDDEPSIIEGLKKIIRWEEYGGEIIGTATSGEEAFEEILKCNADILVTDVRMEGINGLQLIKKLIESGANIKSIVLSGYDDFEYLKEGIKLGIENYILKPVNKEELESTIEVTINKIIDDVTKTFLDSKNMDIIRENVLFRWLRGDIRQNELLERAYLVDINLDMEFYCTAIIKPFDLSDNNTHYEIDKFKIETYSTLNTYFLYESRNKIVVIFFGEYLQRDIVLKELQNYIEKYEKEFEIPFCAALGKIVRGYNNLSQSYSNACEIMEYYLINKNQKVLDESIIESSQQLIQWNNFKIWGIDKAFATKNIHALEQSIEDLVGELKKSHSKPSVVKEVIAAAALEIIICAKNYLPKGIDLHEEESCITQVFKMQDIDKIKELLLSLCRKVLKKSEGIENISPIVYRTIKFIDEKYSQGISLKTVAQELNVNPCYLGKIFKEHTGEFFSDYLNRYRIQWAKIHIRDKMNTGDVYKMVGYIDSNYFYRMFKKYAGTTVVEYKKIQCV